MSFAVDPHPTLSNLSNDPDATSITLGYYQHYKGQYYLLQAVATHSEEQQPYAVYQALYGDFGLWVRPLAMFTEHVAIGGTLQPRFRFVGTTLPETFRPDTVQY